MGVKLTELIPRKQITFDELRGKKIAIDASNMIYQFLSSIRQHDGNLFTDEKGRVTSHLIGIFTRLTNLMGKGIKLCVIFDGKPPILKLKQQELRSLRKEVAKEKYTKAVQEENIELMKKYAKQTSKLDWDMVEESKELIKALGIPVIQAPSEAEAQAAFICEKKDVWAVASSDVDCLLYGSPRMIPNLTLSRKKKLPSGVYVSNSPELIELKNILNNLKINLDQLLVIAILVGTDFNVGGVKGVGAKTALKLVKEYKNFDELFKKVDSDFDWKKIYAVFKSMPIMKNYKLDWKDINHKKVKEILINEHNFSEERVNSILNNFKNTGLSKFVQ